MFFLPKLIIAAICISPSYGGKSCPGCLYGRYELVPLEDAHFTPPIQALKFGLSHTGDCKITFTVHDGKSDPTNLYALYTLTKGSILLHSVHLVAAQHSSYFKQHKSTKTLKKLIFNGKYKVIWIHWRQGWASYKLDPSSIRGGW